MCPVCIGTAVLAWAGGGSAGGLAAMAAVKLRARRPKGTRGAIARAMKPDLRTREARGGK